MRRAQEPSLEDSVGHQSEGLFREKTLFPVWSVQVYGKALRFKTGSRYHPGYPTSDRVTDIHSVKKGGEEMQGVVKWEELKLFP